MGAALPFAGAETVPGSAWNPTSCDNWNILGSVLEETELILMKHDLSAVPKLYKLRVPGCCAGDIF